MRASYLPRFGLEGRRAFVTGGGSGFGRASALALAASGAAVALTELPDRMDAAREVVAEIGAFGGQALALPLDVRELPSIAVAMTEAVARLGGVDTVFANAGTNVQREALAVSAEDWAAVVDVNLRGVFFTLQAGVRAMLAGDGVSQRPGSAIVVSSQLGVVGAPGGGRAAYGASKGGVINLVRTLAIEWAPRGIRVNSVAPATALTPMNAALFADPAWRERMRARIPLGEFITPEDVAAAVVFLASDAARAITGQTVLVDGGWTAQ